MKTALLTSAFICATFFASAQNRMLVLQPGDSIGSLRLMPYDEGYGDVDYNIPPTPLAVSGAFPLEVNFRRLANDAVNTFQFNHLQIHRIAQHDALSLDAHMKVLGASTYEYTTSADWTGAANRIKDKILASSFLREAIYSWLMPVYQRAFEVMSVPEQNDYLQIFRDGISYINTFDLEKEKAVAEGEEPWMFMETRGELNAFIYRRISKSEMSKEECRDWLNRVIRDFESVQRKNPKPADNYVLTQLLNYGYALAGLYSDGGYDEYSHLIVMRKSKDTYELLAAQFEHVSYVRDNFIEGWSEDSTQSTAFFIYDSLGWTFCNSKYNDYCYYHQVLGDKKDQSMMLVSGWEKFPSEKYGEEVMAYCSLVDVDSGTVLVDTFLLPAEVDGGYYTSNYTFPGFNPHRIIYYDPHTQRYGMMDEQGRALLPAKYKSIEATENPGVYKVNGKKKVKV